MKSDDAPIEFSPADLKALADSERAKAWRLEQVERFDGWKAQSALAPQEVTLPDTRRAHVRQPTRTRSESLSPIARTAGVAVNLLTPTASVGGDFVKAGVVRRWVPVTDGFASVMVDKLTFAHGDTIFVVVGLASTSTCMELSLLPGGEPKRAATAASPRWWSS